MYLYQLVGSNAVYILDANISSPISGMCFAGGKKIIREGSKKKNDIQEKCPWGGSKEIGTPIGRSMNKSGLWKYIVACKLQNISQKIIHNTSMYLLEVPSHQQGTTMRVSPRFSIISCFVCIVL